MFENDGGKIVRLEAFPRRRFLHRSLSAVCIRQHYGGQATVDGHPALNRTIREVATTSAPTILFSTESWCLTDSTTGFYPARCGCNFRRLHHFKIVEARDRYVLRKRARDGLITHPSGLHTDVWATIVSTILFRFSSIAERLTVNQNTVGQYHDPEPFSLVGRQISECR